MTRVSLLPCLITVLFVFTTRYEPDASQLLISLTEVTALLSCLAEHNAVLPNKPPLTDPQQGELIFVFCTEFGEYDRAIVLSVDSESVTVRSADYGSQYTEPLSHAREMTCEAVAHPLRAIKCQLEGM